MAAEVCKNCRFFNGQQCGVNSNNKDPNSSCYINSFSPTPNADMTGNICKDCRFFNGQQCGVNSNNKDPNSSCFINSFSHI